MALPVNFWLALCLVGNGRVWRMNTIFVSLLKFWHFCQNMDVTQRLLFLREGLGTHRLHHAIFGCFVQLTLQYLQCLQHVQIQSHLFIFRSGCNPYNCALVLSQDAHLPSPRTPVQGSQSPWPTRMLVVGVGWEVRSWPDWDISKTWNLHRLLAHYLLLHHASNVCPLHCTMHIWTHTRMRSGKHKG